MANRSTRATILATGLLVGGFIGVVLWFGLVDFYHLHFFDTGWIVAADNLVRVVFVAVLCWLIYAPGAGVTALIIPAQERAILTSGERAVVGFGIGAAVWHVAMLILGLANLYYRPVMIVLCLIVLIGSARHFTTVAVSALDSDSGRFSSLWQRTGLARRLAMALVVGAGAWLLLVRGLYPGGGHDYYTHYFPYYLAVLQNHGLKPNDVWYHYYYSKGCGPIFLGMLLTDPEAPALVTFCYVAFAALGVTTLAERLAPRSLWPACGALLYVLCYIVSISAFGGGEFQKDHEEVTALVTISTWAICMAAAVAPTIFLVVATATGIAAAIVTQPAGVVLAAFFALLAGVSVLRRRWRQFSGYGLAAAAIGGTVFGILLLNYVVTGLASDQALDLMLGFANFHRLDRWGVIPQLVIVEWIRDNYDLVVQPVGWLAAYQLVYFMRLDVLWAFLSGVALLLLALCLEHYFCVRPPREDTPGTPDSVAPGIALSTIQRLGLLIGLLVAITVFAGRSQSFSFGRFSSFFVPLLLMLGVACCGWTRSHAGHRRSDRVLRIGAPVLLLCASLVSWQVHQLWLSRVMEVTANAWRFAVGTYSLAEAYTHVDQGGAYPVLPFGGINPRTLVAAHQVPPGTRIWSTDIDAYCMVPGCAIESVVSFKVSGKLDEILDGPPELAKQLLQEAGLNYFLISKYGQFLDLLPYSQLFAPSTIGQYLGVKWTDGSTFLLTWIGPGTKPIGDEFLGVYANILATPENPWFRFSELVAQIGAATAGLRTTTKWGTPNFPWRHQSAVSP